MIFASANFKIIREDAHKLSEPLLFCILHKLLPHIHDTLFLPELGGCRLALPALKCMNHLDAQGLDLFGKTLGIIHLIG